jgi:hypothetical protein
LIWWFNWKTWPIFQQRMEFLWDNRSGDQRSCVILSRLLP